MARVGGVGRRAASSSSSLPVVRSVVREGGGGHEREAAHDKANGGERGWVVCIWFACLLFINHAAEGLSLVMH